MVYFCMQVKNKQYTVKMQDIAGYGQSTTDNAMHYVRRELGILINVDNN